MVFAGGSVVKNLPASAGDAGSVPGLGKLPGRGNGNPLQYSCLKKAHGRGAWRATVHGITKSPQTERAHTCLLNGSVEMPLFWSFFRVVTTDGSLVAWRGWQTDWSTRQGFLRKRLSRRRVTLVAGGGKAAMGNVKQGESWPLSSAHRSTSTCLFSLQVLKEPIKREEVLQILEGGAHLQPWEICLLVAFQFYDRQARGMQQVRKSSNWLPLTLISLPCRTNRAVLTCP